MEFQDLQISSIRYNDLAMSSHDPVSEEVMSSCYKVLEKVRETKLNYAIEETPFTVYITLRKSLNKSFQFSYKPLQILPQTNLVKAENDEIQSLRSKLKQAEKANLNLKDSLEEAVLENEEHFHRIKYLEDQVKKESDNKKKMNVEAEANQEKKLNLLSDAKRVLEIKHEKVCAANKSLKQEKEDLAKDVNKLKVALKSSEKDVKNVTYRFEKKVGTLEENINDLNDFKSSKLSDKKILNLKSRNMTRSLNSSKKKKQNWQLLQKTL